MSGFSSYVQNAIAAWINGTVMPTAPAARYVALFNGDPTDAASGGTEVTTTVRAAGRVSSTWSRSNAVLTSSADVDFGNAAGDATFTHFAVFDASSGGNMLGSNALVGGSKSVLTGTQVIFATGDLTWSVD